MNRGGRRQRFIRRWDAPVWCRAGRWGPRRVRTNECHVVRAEELYTTLLREAAKGHRIGPGSAGTANYLLCGHSLTASWEIRANPIWRFGRVFFRCARCGRLCSRLYLPLADLDLRCRRCYGLSYASRTLQNYKDSLWGNRRFAAIFGTTQRDWAYLMTHDRQAANRQSCAERQLARRRYWRRTRRI